jgi:hypothetical protein
MISLVRKEPVVAKQLLYSPEIAKQERIIGRCEYILDLWKDCEAEIRTPIEKTLKKAQDMKFFLLDAEKDKQPLGIPLMMQKDEVSNLREDIYF